MPPVLPTVSAAAVSAQSEAGEEDGADDEYHAGDDRHPGSGLVDAGRSGFVRRWDGCGCNFLFKCFSHSAILAVPL